MRISELGEACWNGYKRVGSKKKAGKTVPNCVPETQVKEDSMQDQGGSGNAAAPGTVKKIKTGGWWAKNQSGTMKTFKDIVHARRFAKTGEVEETYHGNEFYEAYGDLWFNEDQQLDEAEYQGRSVTLGKPTRGDVKKFKVYVKDPSTGNVKKVNFGDPDMRIKKSNPERRKSFRARHNCDNPGPRTKARYWSCRKW